MEQVIRILYASDIIAMKGLQRGLVLNIYNKSVDWWLQSDRGCSTVLITKIISYLRNESFG